jgi:hypothetical protein
MEQETCLIDIDKYKHLDKASLERFIVEFLYRNEMFMRDYQELLEKPFWDSKVAFYEKYRVWPGRKHSDLRKSVVPRTDRPTDKPKITIPSVVPVRIFPKGQVVIHPVELASEPDEPGHVFVKAMAGVNNREHKPLFGSGVGEFLHALWGYPNSKGDYATGDCLVVKINVRHSAESITEQIEDILKEYRPGKPKRFRKEWKYYLIVYDLKKADPELTYKQIGENLRTAYTDQDPDRDPFSEETCGNYHEKAKNLINGGYKNYV